MGICCFCILTTQTHWKLETGARINRNEHHIQFPVRERWALFRNQKSKCEIKLNNAEITKLELVLIDFYKSGSGGNLLFFHNGQGSFSSFSSLQTQENGKQRRIDEVWILIVTPGEFTTDTFMKCATSFLQLTRSWLVHDDDINLLLPRSLHGDLGRLGAAPLWYLVNGDD